MGCDIHMWAEIRKEQGWEKVGNEFDQPSWMETDEKTDQPYEGRNYDLFGILAGVRNGEGFAGCDTGDGFKPIAEPRGIPADASAEFRREADEWGTDGHSHSWLLLSEVLAFDWQQVTNKRGVVDDVQYLAHKEGRPFGYSGDVSGGLVFKADREHMEAWFASEPFKLRCEMEERLKGMGGKAAARLSGEIWLGFPHYVTKIEWPVTYYEAVGAGWWDAVEKLKTMADPNDLRLVFFFDN